MKSTTATTSNATAAGIPRQKTSALVCANEGTYGPVERETDDVIVSVVLTVLNDASGCKAVLEALGKQDEKPLEIIVVDGGSVDGTLRVIEIEAALNPHIRMVTAPGANISEGRNRGIAHAQGRMIALTDSGCRPRADWLVRLIQPFRSDKSTEIVGGAYRVEAHSLWESVVGLTTMRGQLDLLDSKTFKPSARSMAFTKEAWRRAGGFPEWLYTAEDTLFNLKMDRLGVVRRLAEDAVVAWRPRSSIFALAKQFYFYGRGEGHIASSMRSPLYHFRNALIVSALIVVARLVPIFWMAVTMALAYILIAPYHDRSLRVAGRLNRPVAYGMALVVNWIVAISGTIGQSVGAIERRWNRRKYADPLDAYLGPAEN